MKRNFLLIFFLLTAVTSTLHAQSFEFQYQGRTLADGDTVTIAAEENAFGELACETNPASNPAHGLLMNLLMGIATNVTATLEITENTLTCSQLQWCMGGECQPFGSATRLIKQFKASATEQVQFDAYGIEGDGILIAKLRVASVLGTQSVYIRFFSGTIDSITKPTRDSKRATSGGKAVYTLAGQRLIKANSSTLNKGIYIIGGRKVLL